MKRSAAPRLAGILALAAAAILLPAPAHALKFATWNMLAYPEDSLSYRQPLLRTILAALDPDILAVQEMDYAEGRDSLLNNVLNVIEPGQWTGTWLSVGTNQGHAVFWKTAKVNITNITVTNPPSGGSWPRLTMLGVVKPVGYVRNGAWFRFYSFHLKAGTPSSSTTDSTQRRVECTSLRTTINNQITTSVGPNFLICGDSNFYTANEGGYIRLTESQSNNNGRTFDPLSMPGDWHTVLAYAPYYTQCPCNSGCWSFGTTGGQSGGGMDDRFDLILPSATLVDGAGLDLVPGSTVAFGNDGNHFNTDINGGGTNTAVGITVANALHGASDHIPVMITLQLPAKYSAPSQLSFGAAIVGSSPTRSLAVANAAGAPAEGLAYTLGAGSGFSAPGGPFSAAAGAAANLHTLGMDATATGVKTGTVTLASNDNDTTSKAILLDGRVVGHAVPSLDSATVITSGTCFFGDHLVGGFTDQPVRVFDPGWEGGLQARLDVSAASISGDPHFSIVGFSPTTVGSPGATWAVHFDDTTAPPDSDYDATLTFTTADEAIPGGTALAPLGVWLHAHVSSGNVGVGGRPLALRFDPPRPNPARAGTSMSCDLPREAHVALGVYDLSGRRIARLADGVMGQGHHVVRWNTQDDAGQPVPAGLYFVRFETPGLRRVARLVLLP